MKTTMKVVNGVRVATSTRDAQGGRSGSVNGLSSAEITKLLGVRPMNPNADGKVTKEWTFTLDGVECSMWDYKSSGSWKEFSTNGPDGLFRLVFGAAYVAGV